MLLKEIKIGSLIQEKVNELEIDTSRISNFLKCSEQEVKDMYEKENLPTDVLLRWCKLLGVDFFRLYSQHLILYAPPHKHQYYSINKKSKVNLFRKNLYTEDMIRFIVELVKTNQKTKKQVIEDYKIPKTTIHKWLQKFEN